MEAEGLVAAEKAAAATAVAETAPVVWAAGERAAADCTHSTGAPNGKRGRVSRRGSTLSDKDWCVCV